MKNDITAIEEIAERGFAVVENVFSATECDGLLNVLQSFPRPAGRAGMRHLMRIPEIAAAAHDPRLLAIARETLGPTAIPYKATLFEKNPNANWSIVWHQDTALPLETAFENPEWGPWSRKDGLAYAHAPAWALARVMALRLHLDAATDAMDRCASSPARTAPAFFPMTKFLNSPGNFRQPPAAPDAAASWRCARWSFMLRRKRPTTHPGAYCTSSTPSGSISRPASGSRWRKSF